MAHDVSVDSIFRLLISLTYRVIVGCEIFNVAYDSARYLNLEEVIALTSYKEEKQITKNKNRVF